VHWDPANAAAHARRGALLATAGRTAEAVQHLAEACRLDPHQPETFYNLGILHTAERRYADAAAAYRRGDRACGPDWAEPLNNLAWLAGDLAPM